MTQVNPFDPERDPALGALLREALHAGDEGSFIGRVRASVALARQERTLDVLSRWMRPSIAAAAVLLVSGLLWWSQSTRASTAGTATVAELLVNDSVPTQEILLAGLLEAR
jgi:hypothetical protein